MSDRHQVVVIGSGFGGLFGTKALKNADVDVVAVCDVDPAAFAKRSALFKSLPHQPESLEHSEACAAPRFSMEPAASRP